MGAPIEIKKEIPDARQIRNGGEIMSKGKMPKNIPKLMTNTNPCIKKTLGFSSKLFHLVNGSFKDDFSWTFSYVVVKQSKVLDALT